MRGLKYFKIAAAVMLFMMPIGAAAIGISPNAIDLLNIQSEFPATREFLISRADASVQVSVLAEWSGTGAEYIEPEIISPFVMLLGQKVHHYKFKIGKVGAVVGEYDATLKIKFFGGNGDDDAVDMAIAEGVVGKVHFSITDKVISKSKISYVSLRVDEGNNAIVKYTISNEGNAQISYGKIILVNRRDDSIIEQRLISDNVVGQFSQREFIEEFKLKKKPKSGDVFRADIYNNKGELALSSNDLIPVAFGGEKISAKRMKVYKAIKTVALASIAVLLVCGLVLLIKKNSVVKKDRKKKKNHRRSSK